MSDPVAPIAESHIDLDARIRRRAHEIWESHAHDNDTALEDWLQAEREIVGDSPQQPAQDRATVIGPA